VGVAATAAVAFGLDQHMLAESGQMLTTDRTTIRRRLEIGRAAYRPPWSRRKRGHRSIVAPLTATLAAGVAVGVGVVIARATRERRAARLPRRERRLGLRAGEPPSAGLQRMALGQIDIAIEQLEGTSTAGPTAAAKSVHETRKALKRLRALLRLLRHELGDDAFAREDAAVRDIARSLSGARDAEVMLATLDALIRRHPRKLARHKGVRKLRRELADEQRRMTARTLGDSATRARVIADLGALRSRVSRWSLPGGAGTKLVQLGLRGLYAQGRRRFRDAKRRKGRDIQSMHRWRKRVKDLRYVAEMLARDSRPKGKRRATDARLRRLAKRADSLGETLGEDHDLAVLAERVRKGPKRRGARKTLLKLIARRRRELRKAALRDGKRLYRRSPVEFVRGLSRR
jgi:CHAD domain-containing protein